MLPFMGAQVPSREVIVLEWPLIVSLVEPQWIQLNGMYMHTQL